MDTFARLMAKSRQLFTLKEGASSMLMLLLLSWLTVCLPFVNQSQKAAKAQTAQSSKGTKSDDTNPLSNTNEEKSESGTSLLSEYLHEAPVLEHHVVTLITSYKGHPSSIYIAFHPDRVIPPPKA